MSPSVLISLEQIIGRLPGVRQIIADGSEGPPIYGLAKLLANRKKGRHHEADGGRQTARPSLHFRRLLSYRLRCRRGRLRKIG